MLRIYATTLMGKRLAPVLAPETGSGTGIQEQDQSGNPDGQSNAGDFSSPWVTMNNKEQAGNNESQQQQQPQNVNANDAFNEHVASLGLSSGIDVNAIAAGLQDGNTESLSAAFNQVGANAYKAAMLNSAKLMDQKVEAAVKQAVAQAGGNYQQDQAVHALTSALPFTSNPKIAPVAKAAMQGYMKQGQDSATAIESVRKFFKEMHGLSAKDLGFNAPGNAPGSSGFGGNGFANGGSDTDWTELFK